MVQQRRKLENITFINLRDFPNTAYLNDFITLYSTTFTDTSEAEDPSVWSKLLMDQVSKNDLCFNLLVALYNGQVIGGLAFEYYYDSECALLTYIVVRQEYRRKNVARNLVDNAKEILIKKADEANKCLKAIFAETEDPIKLGSKADKFTYKRVDIIEKLGGKRIDFDYIQPQLAGGADRCRHLSLVVFPLNNEKTIAGKIVKDFLNNFYQVLNDDKDSEFLEMKNQIKDTLNFKENRFRFANSNLSCSRVAVCLHFITSDDSYNDCPTGNDPYFTSYETDLLSYQFQQYKQFSSYLLQTNIKAQIIMPDTLTYITEGREMTLITQQKNINVKISLSRTVFNESKISVWHLVFTPDECEFTEFTIIALIHLYDGRSEQTNSIKFIRFRVENEEKTLQEFFKTLSKRKYDEKTTFEKQNQECTPVAGTIQIITSDQTVSRFQISRLLKFASEYRSLNGNLDKEQALIRNDLDNPYSTVSRQIQSICGIITGIFDFDEIDTEEILDTLAPTFSDNDTYIKINRGTFIFISPDDRVANACIDNIDISPYLLLPHSIILHNEHMVTEARILVAGIDNNDSLATLQQCHTVIYRNIYSLIIPNIFNYITEQTLYEEGLKIRGFNQILEMTKTKYTEVSKLLDKRWKQRNDTSDKYSTILLAAISIMQITDPINKLIGHVLHIDANKSANLEYITPSILLFAIIIIINKIWNHRESHNFTKNISKYLDQ